MDLPLVGVGLPAIGPHAGPEAIDAMAVAAERLGFHSVSVSERLLVPAHPGWTNDVGLPDHPTYDGASDLSGVWRVAGGPPGAAKSPDQPSGTLGFGVPVLFGTGLVDPRVRGERREATGPQSAVPG